jgi:hypothetical protein
MVILKAHYFFEHCNWYRECLIIDISRKGACTKLPIDEKIIRGAVIFLEIFNKQFQSTTVRGTIIWIKQTENAFIIGIKFKKVLDSHTFQTVG